MNNDNVDVHIDPTTSTPSDTPLIATASTVALFPVAAANDTTIFSTAQPSSTATASVVPHGTNQDATVTTTGFDGL